MATYNNLPTEVTRAVEERSRDTGEWWDYCNDCYEKDQAEDEEESEQRMWRTAFKGLLYWARWINHELSVRWSDDE
jgi:hypothetical protein